MILVKRCLLLPQAERLQRRGRFPCFLSFRLQDPRLPNSFIALLLRNAHHLFRWASLSSCILITNRDCHPWLRNADSPRVNVANLRRSDESPKRPREHYHRRNRRQKEKLPRLLPLHRPLQHRIHPSKLSNRHSQPKLRMGSLFRPSLRRSPPTCR